MPLYQTSAGDRILAADIDQFYNLLKGVAASGEAITLIYNGTSLIFQPSSDPSAGTRVLDIKNAAGTHLASLDFNGVLELLAAAAAPSGAVAGALYWDTLLSALRVHDGTNWRDIAGSNAGPLPNLVLNSDFGRRTVFGLAMPEVFADTSAWTAAVGTLGSVASNILTAGTVGTWGAKWTGPASFWRDARWSATFKFVDVTTANSAYQVDGRYVDENNWVSARWILGTGLVLTKNIAGATTNVATVAFTPTVNQWYWLEIEMQGTTGIAKIYSTGVTTPGTTKAASTLQQTVTGTIADAAVVAGGIAVRTYNIGSAGQVGGIATGNGGVYVETWLPESYTFAFTGGTQPGGLAVGLDESADSGPINKQWALRAYVPATTRTLVVTQDTPDGSVIASVSYTASVYLKTASETGTALAAVRLTRENSALASQGTSDMTDAGETSWTRKTVTATTEAGTRRARITVYANRDAAATGTAYFMLPQLEQGSGATAWRNAPADDAPIVWSLTSSTNDVLAADGEVNSRDLAANIFLPWDATLTVHVSGVWANSGANADYVQINVGGTKTIVAALNGTTVASFAGTISKGTLTGLAVSAGKTRVPLLTARAAGSVTFYGTTYAQTNMTIVATRGK